MSLNLYQKFYLIASENRLCVLCFKIYRLHKHYSMEPTAVIIKTMFLIKKNKPILRYQVLAFLTHQIYKTH